MKLKQYCFSLIKNWKKWKNEKKTEKCLENLYILFMKNLIKLTKTQNKINKTSTKIKTSFINIQNINKKYSIILMKLK